MSYRLIIQIILVTVSFFIVTSYITPKISDLRVKQAEVASYRDAISKAELLFNKLNSLLNKISSLNQAELQSLNRFLPESVDEVAVAQDIESIALRSGIKPTDIGVSKNEEDKGKVSYVQEEQSAFDESDSSLNGDIKNLSHEKISTHDFSLTASGSYADFINFLSEIEHNSYPLRVSSVTIDQGSEEVSGTYTFKLNFETYSFINSQ